ncbi:fibrinogen alpha chain [Aulostomus maculatus]
MRPRQPDESHDRLTGPGGFKAPERRRRAAFSDESNAARMERLIPCFILICMASFGATVLLDPRGARPVEPSTRGDQCATQREWPFCTSDEWIVKCPSGCRIQGLMDKYDHGLLRKIEKIRSLLDQYKAKHRSTDLVSKQTYDFLREKLTLDADGDTKYSDLAMTLRQRIVDMKIKIDRQLRILQALKDRVKDQVAEMQKLEVDIDIKLRSCKGSCQSYTEYQVDQESYVTLDKQVTQLDSQTVQNIETVGTLYVMKSRPLKEDDPGSLFKSKDVDADVFHDVKNVQLSLEMEGTLASPATISKVPGSPSFSSSTSSTSASTSSTSSKSLTELSGYGGGDLLTASGALGGSTTTHITTTACTKNIRKTTVHTNDGPVEKIEEVMEGGPECQGVTDLTKGGLGLLFPDLFHTSSSTSSPTTVHKIVHTGDTKGSIYGDSKTGLSHSFTTDPFADDLGAFLKGTVDDDVPDVHARSFSRGPVKRQADYIGKDCVEAFQDHLKGETNGLFKIKPGSTDSLVEVYCHQEGLMGGWLLVQRRETGALNFNRTWAEYRDGFGSVDAQGEGEIWLGNQNLHLLTSQGETILKVELEDWEGGTATAEYIIKVGSEEEGYPLHVSGYVGDAGDALVNPKSDMASYLSHNGMKFSTFDRDNDKWVGNCAEMYGGGWWYNNCQSVNLNGIYYEGSYDPKKKTPNGIENGVVWATYRPANYSLKTVTMFVRSAVL